MEWRFSLKAAYLTMIAVVSASNYLVQFPINDWLTWGAFTYPISFLITDLTNRMFGSKSARQVVYVGFIFAAIFSLYLSTPKIALASITAFLVSQLLDIVIFGRLRQRTWWIAPFFSSFFASIIDTAIFWTLAFYGEDLPILSLATGDFSIKLLLDIAMLTPFRIAIRHQSRIDSTILVSR